MMVTSSQPNLRDVLAASMATLPTAENGNPAPRFSPISQRDAPEIGDRIDHLGILIFAFDSQFMGVMGTNGDKKRFKSFRLQLLKLNIFSQPGIEPKFNPQFFDHGDFTIDDLSGKSVSRNPHHHHAAGHGKGIQDRNAVPFQGQEKRQRSCLPDRRR